MNQDHDIMLKMEDINKSFGEVQVLKNINFQVGYGQCCGLIGENGSGKSTLMKILTGVYKKEADGKIYFRGNILDPGKYVDITKAGIAMVHQEVNIFPYLSVAENMFLGHLPQKMGMIDWKNLYRMAGEQLELMGVENLDIRKPLGEYGAGIQQIVVIARALLVDSRLLVLDEPTSSLDEEEIEILFRVLRRLLKQKISIIYISHKLDELFEICDKVYVIRDGKNIADYDINQVTKVQLITDMIGKSADHLLLHTPLNIKNEKKVLRAEHFKDYGKIKDCSVEIKHGEMVGLLGLLGSGRTEFANLLFGVTPKREGVLYLDGDKVSVRSPREAVRKRMSFLTEDRKYSGLIPEMSVRENLVLSAGRKISRFGIINRKKEKILARELAAQFDVRCESLEKQIALLSGGNQQKVLLARLMAINPKLVILDSPTRGIDIQSKDVIEQTVRELQKDGVSFLLISSELPELIRNCQRVITVIQGSTVGELQGKDITEEAMIRLLANSVQG